MQKRLTAVKRLQMSCSTAYARSGVNQIWILKNSSRKHTYIILTPLLFLFLFKNRDCGYSLEPPRRGGSNEYPQSMFKAEIWKISEFLSENIQFFEVKFSIYLNRRVFVMSKELFQNLQSQLFCSVNSISSVSFSIFIPKLLRDIINQCFSRISHDYLSLLAHLSTKCSWWAVVVSQCRSWPPSWKSIFRFFSWTERPIDSKLARKHQGDL